jgi:hypothetical protein
MPAVAFPQSETFTVNVAGDIYLVELSASQPASEESDVIRCIRTLRYTDVPAHLHACDAVSAARLQQRQRHARRRPRK